MLQALELLGAELSACAKDRRRNHRAEADRGDPTEGPKRRVIRVARRSLRLQVLWHREPGRELGVDLARALPAQVGRPAVPAEGRLDRDITVVIAGDQEDLLGGAQSLELLARGFELARERDVGQVSGDEDAIDGLGLHVAKRSFENLRAVVSPAADRPGSEARETFAPEAREPPPREGRGMPIGEVGETDDLAQAFDPPPSAAGVEPERPCVTQMTFRHPRSEKPAGVARACDSLDRRRSKAPRSGSAQVWLRTS